MSETNRQTKIFFLITKGNFGGAQRYVYELATGLVPTKYDIKVILGEGAGLEDKLSQAGIKVYKIPSLKRDIGLLSDIKSLWILIKLFRNEKPDIIHLNSSKIGGLGALAGRLTGISKIVFTGHGWTFNEDRNPLSKLIIRVLVWLTISMSHQTIMVSKTTQSQAPKWLIKSGKITVIYNGIAPSDSTARQEARHLIAGRSTLLKDLPASNLTWLGTIAELHPNKGLDQAIKASAQIVKDHPEIIYVIIGEGEQRKNLEKLIERLDLRESVILVGAIPEARKYLKAFDIFLLPSRTEALPYVLLEAGLSSLPVVATKVGGIPEIITHQKSGLIVDQNDSQAITAAILTLLSDPTLMTKYGQNLHQHIESQFTLRQMIEQTEKIYLS